jgi:predicted class III extradiol MEMO1 family dioxygenase
MKMRARFKPASEDPAVRLPAMAGQFYPENPEELRTMVDGFLAAAKTVSDKIPKAIIAPHAGYPYSGPIAGSAYACLARGRGTLKRVVLLGPSHFVAFPGLAASSASFLQIALGEFKLVPLMVGDATANLFPDMSPRKKVTSGRAGGQLRENRAA